MNDNPMRDALANAIVRMTACVAACAGIPTDKLRPGRLAAQDAEIAALKDEVGYWKSQSADFGRKVDDLSDAHDAIVIERDRLREALTTAADQLAGMAIALRNLDPGEPCTTADQMDAWAADARAALSPEPPPAPSPEITVAGCTVEQIRELAKFYEQHTGEKAAALGRKP